MLTDARKLIQQASHIAVLTGAGISAESGIPTFRGPGGLWRNFRPEDLATPEAFARDPILVWEWYQWRRGIIAHAEPHAGHFALVALESRKGRTGFTLITQNVDGLHDRAGSSAPLKLHGDIWTLRCTCCAHSWVDLRPDFNPFPPACPECQSLARPGVVWFGESLPQDTWRLAEQAVTFAELILVIGTSSVVFPAAGLIPLARHVGTKVIEVNPEETPISDSVDFHFRAPAGELLPLLLE